MMIESDKEKEIVHCKETLADYINNNIKEIDESYKFVTLDIDVYLLDD